MWAKISPHGRGSAYDGPSLYYLEGLVRRRRFVQIFDLSGKLITSTIFNKKTVEFNLGSFKAGSYYLRSNNNSYMFTVL